MKAGVLADKADTIHTYDRFRGRIMFPIAQADGQIVGFGARLLREGPDAGPKYLNGPETAVYKKGRLLYGLDKAAEQIRKAREAILVEGYVDVLAMHQAGFRHTVGACGVALTDDHVAALKRGGAERLTLLFDADAAGGAAPLAAALPLLRAGREGRVATRPRGSAADRDGVGRADGRAALVAVSGGAVALTEQLIDHFAEKRCPGGLSQAAAEERLLVVRDLTPFLAATADETFRSLFTKRLAKRVDLDIGVLRATIRAQAKT